MAAFGDDDAMTSSMYSSMRGSQPLKRVEPAIQKFTKIVIPTDLERLRQHKVNIEKFQRQTNWPKLTTEQVNARQTVQQLIANIREMEKTRSLIVESDLPAFDSRVYPIKEEAIRAIVEFTEMNDIDKFPLGEAHPRQIGAEGGTSLRKRNVESSRDCEVIGTENSVDGVYTESEPTNEADSSRLMTQQQALVQSKESMESWQNLQNDLMALNSVVHEFATHVRQQGETVDNIADNIDKAEGSVTTGRKYLIKATTIKAAVLPVGGAIIGGCLGGPIGLYAGLKIGTVAALGGGALGFVGGKLLKKHKDKQASVELREIEHTRARLFSDPGPSRSDGQKKTR